MGERKMVRMPFLTSPAVVERCLVQVGDVIQLDAPLVEVETDKATILIPSPTAGVVAEILISVGRDLTPGDPLLVIDADFSA